MLFKLKHRLYVVLVSLATICVFAGLGWLIGITFENPALGILLGVIISYPFNMYALTKLIKKDTKEIVDEYTKQ